MKNAYTTVSNAAFYEALREDSAEGETNWTINRHARRGDHVIMYVCAPVSAIVATATVATDPEQDDDPASEWFGHYLADMKDLTLLAEPVTRARLVADFPGWGYWKQPRNSVRVPERVLAGLKMLVGSAR
jgi:uncharacterized protein YsxB (DUF464 family)